MAPQVSSNSAASIDACPPVRDPNLAVLQEWLTCLKGASAFSGQAQRASSGARRLRRVPLERRVGRYVFDEMKTRHCHAFPFIKPMGVFSLDS